jgi:SWI/SNF-related matrix-associated actin-dependent regulator 1 of chromatin subfamily A
MLANLFPHQRIAVDFILQEKKVMLTDAPGLGKSRSAITAIVQASSLPCLIVCPARIRLNWRREIERWFPEHADRFSVVSYEGLASGRGGDDYKSIICDEVHNFKNPKSIRHNALLDACEDIEYAVLLTGTPVVNRPSDGKVLLSIVGADSDAIYASMKGDTLATSEHKAGRPILGRSHSFVRKTWPEVLPFPPVDRQLMRISPKSDIPYLDLAAESDRHILSELHHQRCLAFSQKKDDVVVLARGLKEKTILFTWFRAHAMEIAEAMPDSHYIDGSLSFDEREEIIKKFHEDNIPILIATLPSTGEGLNITCAKSVIFADLPWTPAAIEQGEARAARIGQTSKTTSYIPIQMNSLDDDIWGLLEAKMEYADEFSEGDFIKTLKDKIQAAAKKTKIKEEKPGGPPEEVRGFYGLNKHRFEQGEYDAIIRWTRPGLSLIGRFISTVESEGQYGKYTTAFVADNDNLLLKFSLPAMLKKAMSKIKPTENVHIKYEGEFESDFTEGRTFKKFTVTKITGDDKNDND